MKKKYYFIFTALLLMCLIYSLRVSIKLNEIEESYGNKQRMVMSDHILSFNLIDELNGEKILESEYPLIDIQNIIYALKKTDISNMHLFRNESIDISNFYKDYIYLLEQYKIEEIKKGYIEDKKKFQDVINDLSIIKNWLEDRYHSKNFKPYTYQELKEHLDGKLKYANFE